jgi:hypothetical protein
MARTKPAVRWIQAIGRRFAQVLRGDYHAATLRAVPSWGMSFLFHALLLLLLAFIIQIRQAPVQSPLTLDSALVETQLGEIESLNPDKRSGDPFTLDDSPDPPSLGLELSDPDIKLVGQPRIPAMTQYAPALAGPLLTSSAKAQKTSLQGILRLPGVSTTIVAPFSGRQELTRARLVRREGGTAISEKSVEDGIDWLVRHQRADGSWSLNFQDQCNASPCPSQRVMDSDTAATGLSLLPLLGAGYIHTVKSRHQDSVRRGLEWLVAHQQPEGDLFIGPPGMAYLYSHAIGTMAICEALGLSGDPALKRPAQLALKFICDAQDPVGGGWRYRPGQLGDTSVFGWQLFALRSGHLAGLKVPRSVIVGCSRYLDQAGDQKRVIYSYQPGRPATPTMTAEALLSRQLLGWPRDYPPLVKGVGQISADLQSSGDRNIYYWYYATQLLHNMRNEQWKRWNVKIREGLIGLQVKEDGCAHGSWDPFLPQPDQWAETAGRLYLTSLSILTLEVYYRYLPLYRTGDDAKDKMDDGTDEKGDVSGKKDQASTKKQDVPTKKSQMLVPEGQLN